MKFFIVALTLAVICSVSALTDEQKDHARQYHVQCLEENNVSEETRQAIRANVRNGTFTDGIAPVLAKCFFQKAGALDENGEYQESVAIDKLSKGGDRAQIEAILKECKSSAGDNKDEFLFRLYVCLRMNLLNSKKSE